MSDVHRLPRTVVPSRYSLTVEPDLDAAAFRGTEEVAVDVVQPVTEVVLHAVDLTVDAAWLTSTDGRRLACSPLVDEASGRLALTLEGTATPGPWTLHLEFQGALNDKLKGFYRSVFTDDEGVERVIGTTQMEPTDARRAFPCWDEPDFKAVFSITLVVAEGLMAISNAGVVSETPTADGRVAVAFADTIPMSTYLVAFVVGPLEATAPVDVDGVPLRVVHVPGKAHLAPYALEVGAFCLRYFADYYGIAYPGDKCDLIALPDFAAGAMENLGAITFREAVLLVDPDAVTQLELQRVADVVAHELAHMWFGDLVTMKWWNGLWLNEAFATFMELAAVDAFKPEWHRWVAFTNERAAAFAVDSLASTRPIEYPVLSPAEAEGMFDVLTYQKGASVLRMLEQYLGTESFRAGIRLYLTTRQFGNAETTDLWDAIEEATGEPVRRIMDSWIFQGGYPLVSVRREDGGLGLAQERFVFAGADAAEPAVWAVPLLVAPLGPSKGGELWPVLLEKPTDVLDRRAEHGAVVNAGGHGFYRVAYAPELLQALRDHLDVLAPIERALLLDDTWAAVLAGRVGAAAYLELARGYSGETDRTVWTTLASGLGGLDRLLEGEDRARFQAVVRRLVRPTFERLGWAPEAQEGELTRQLRGTVIATLGTLGADPEVRATAKEVHNSYLAEPSAIDANVAAAVLNVLASVGGPADHDLFWSRYKASESPQESLRYLYALSGFPGRAEAEKTLGLTLTNEIRSQNAPSSILLLLANRDVNRVAWSFVRDEWDRLNERFPDNAIPRMLQGITALSTPDVAAEVEAFLSDHPVPHGQRIVDQHLERLRVNVALRRREGPRLARALQEPMSAA